MTSLALQLTIQSIIGTICIILSNLDTPSTIIVLGITLITNRTQSITGINVTITDQNIYLGTDSSGIRIVTWVTNSTRSLGISSQTIWSTHTGSVRASQTIPSGTTRTSSCTSLDDTIGEGVRDTGVVSRVQISSSWTRITDRIGFVSGTICHNCSHR